MIINVAVPCPLNQTFDYKILTDSEIKVGQRVQVPFGRGERTLVAIILEVNQTSEYALDALKEAHLIDAEIVFDANTIALGRWIASYYHAPIGLVFQMMLPSFLRKNKSYEIAGEKWLEVTEKGALWQESNPKEKKKLEIIQYISSFKDKKTASSIIEAHFPVFKQHKKWLVDNGLIVEHIIPFERSERKNDDEFPKLSFKLNHAQNEAIKKLEFDKFGVLVLEGVTGSGKTAVYIEMIKKALKRSEQVLILVPEIGLTEQFVLRMKQNLNVPIAIVHSEISNKEKEYIWQKTKANEIPVVIGTRSALFTPFAKLGLMIIDESHDASFVQHDTVRYSAHDTAIKRASIEKIPIVLGSATPSLETLYNVKLARYNHVELKERAKGEFPEWTIINTNDEFLYDGLTNPLLEAIEKTLNKKEQVMIYLNRRGFSPILRCDACGWMPECDRCSYRLTVYQKKYQLKCHHCGFTKSLPKKCPNCASTLLSYIGEGTEKIDQVLSNAFPKAKITRFDREVISSKQQFESLVKTVLDEETDIIIGTQMIAKGHDFPKVTLVGVLDIDRILFSSDFRAEEKLAQTLMQVSGRAGREITKSSVIIQTAFPEHSIFTELPKIGYHQYANYLLKEREELGFPPMFYQALFQIEGKDALIVQQEFQALIVKFKTYQLKLEMSDIIPNALQKRKHYYRFHVVLQSDDRKKLHEGLSLFLLLAQKELGRSLRYFCEVDPVDFG